MFVCSKYTLYFCNVKQGSRLVKTDIKRKYNRRKPNYIRQNFQQVRLHQLDFLFYNGSAYLFCKTYRVESVHSLSDLSPDI